jgi:predicted transcriptional regulator
MDIQFTPEQVAKLAQIGSTHAKQPEEVVHEIIARALADDARFREAVHRGIQQADRGEFIEEEDMDARVERMFSRSRGCAGRRKPQPIETESDTSRPRAARSVQ